LRSYEGNRPTGEEWTWIEDEDINHTKWSVFSKPAKNNSDWATIKVVANGKVERKANFWFAWNIKLGSFAAGRDAKIMEEHFTELFVFVKDILSWRLSGFAITRPYNVSETPSVEVIEKKVV